MKYIHIGLIKSIILSIVIIPIGILPDIHIYAQLSLPDINSTILNPDINTIIDPNFSDDPIRDGATRIINDGTNSIVNIIGSDQPNNLASFESAKGRTIDIINRIINYALGILGLIALSYLIYNGILIITTAGNEERYKEGVSAVKYAAIALAGIGLSWLLVSLIFYLIDIVS